MRTARTPLIPVSLCAVLMLAACGSDESVSTPTDPTLAPPVAVSVVGSLGSQDAAAAAPLDMTAENDDRSTGLLPVFGGYEFEVGEGLPALPTNSTGYHFAAGATVDAAEVARIAAALGVTGEPQPGVEENGTLWQVGPDDGTAPVLTVSADSQLSWYYSSAWATTASSGCGVSGTPEVVDDGVTVDADVATVDAAAAAPATDVPGDTAPATPEDCARPAPPEGVPTADEAAALVNELLTALGEDPAGFELETYADEWSASVTAYTTIGGLRWPSGHGFGFGEHGALQWANGTLAEPIATGPYPLVDLDTAVARLTDQNGMWAYGSDVMTLETPAVDEPVSEDGEATPDPAEPIVATLVDVQPDLWWVYDTDDSVWLLPAYTFTDTGGTTFTVPAVTDEYMIVVEPEPAPAEPVDPVVVEPEPAPAEPVDPVVVDPAIEVPADPAAPASDPAVPD